jgi:hypothetical protein
MSERYDPADFPILVELEEEFAQLVAERLEEEARARAASQAQAEPRSPRPRARRRGEHLRTGRRIARRAALVGALIGVVGATALAAKSVVSGGSSPNASVVLKTDVTHGVTLRRYHGSLCLDVSYAGGVATHCTRTPDRPAAVAALSAVTPGGRVVTGVTGAGVDQVKVTADGHTATVPATDSGDGHGTRWFTAALAGVPDRDRPTAAVLTPLRADGTPAGRPVADCSLGTEASCQAAMVRSGTLARAPVNKP